jgi:hypothetical protein
VSARPAALPMVSCHCPLEDEDIDDLLADLDQALDKA